MQIGQFLPVAQTPAPVRKLPSREAAGAAETPLDRVETSPLEAPSAPQGIKLPRWTSLSNAVLGAALSGASHLGSAIEWAGRKVGLWENLGQVQKPLPPSQLGDLPRFQLERPVVIVPGFHTPKDRFDHLVEKLTAGGANGGRAYYVRDGQFFEDQACTRSAQLSRGAEAKVFVAVFHTTRDTPDESAPQLKESLAAIRKFSGASDVDVAGYSMGGLATRKYLDQGGDGIDHFLMVATPNQGSALARTSMWLLDLKEEGWSIDWLLQRKPIKPEDRPALEWLRPVDSPRPNEQLRDLNSRWDQQRARVQDAMAIGSASRWTLATGGHPVHGNGTVPIDSVQLPGLPTVVTHTPLFGNHGHIMSKPEVYLQMGEFFGWNAQSP